MNNAEKVVIHRSGTYEVLEIETFTPDPPARDEVLIAVEAAGINYADCIVRMGLYQSAKEYVGWPITPGFEVAGTIQAVGSEVTHLTVGDPVIAVSRFGGYTSHLHVPAHQVFQRPEGMSAKEGATLPAVFMTAWYALFELAHPRPGQHVLIHSAAGGVGSALIQLAKHHGLLVTGVVGATHKTPLLRELGADYVIDKSQEDLWTSAKRIAPRGFDVIFDANGVSTLSDSYAHLRRPGKLVVYGFAAMLPKEGKRMNWAKLAVDYLRTPRFDPMTLTRECKSVMAFNLSYLFDETEIMREGLTLILNEWKQNRIRSPRITPYRLQDVQRAHRDLETGQTVGKLVLLTGK